MPAQTQSVVDITYQTYEEVWILYHIKRVDYGNLQY